MNRTAFLWISVLTSITALAGMRTHMEHPTVMPLAKNDDRPLPGSRSDWLHRNRTDSTVRYSRHARSQAKQGQAAEFAGGQRKAAGRPMQPDRFPALQTRHSLAAGTIPSAVTAGDFNRDGKADFVVSNLADNSLWIYIGKGNGTFQTPRIIPLHGNGPTWLISADLRQNGLLDLVVTEADSCTIGILLGYGDGTFEAERLLSLPAAPMFVMSGDFNRDSRVDLVVGLEKSLIVGPVVLFPGSTPGEFGRPIFKQQNDYAAVLYMDAADLNGDGYLDLVVAEILYRGAQVLINNRDGTFSEGQAIYRLWSSSGILSLTLGKLNEDDYPDLVVTDAERMARIFLGKGDGTFGTCAGSYVTGNMGICSDLADLNGDGHQDAIIGTYTTDENSLVGFLFVMFGDGKGAFHRFRIYRSDPDIVSISLADFNADGAMDLVAAETATNSCTLFINDRRGDFGSPFGHLLNPMVVSGVNLTIGAQFSDLNGDSLQDLVLLQSDQSVGESILQVCTLLNDGRGGFHDPILSETGIRERVGDFLLGNFRNTGSPDMVISGFQQELGQKNFLGFLPNLGKGRMGPADRFECNGGWITATGDFNRDGGLDIVSAYALHGISGTFSHIQHLDVYLGHGDGTFSLGSTIDFGGLLGRYPIKIQVGDYNRDGFLDTLVWLYYNQVPYCNHDVVEFLGNGDGTFRSPTVVLPNLSAFSMGDFNRDGNPDIVAIKDTFVNWPILLHQPILDLYHGRVDGTFSLTATLEPYDGEVFNTWDPVVSDFNGDGNADIWVPQSGYFQILLGNGDGTFLPTHYKNSYNLLGHHLFTDWDADGWADMAEILWNSQWIMFSRGVRAPSLIFESISYPVYGCCGTAILSLNTAAQVPVTVYLSAGDAAVKTPQSIVVPPGFRSVGFNFTISKEYDSAKVIEIYARLGNDTVSMSTILDGMPCRGRRRP